MLLLNSSAWACWPLKAGIFINWTVGGDSKLIEQRENQDLIPGVAQDKKQLYQVLRTTVFPVLPSL